MKKQREKANNTGKTQGILSCSERGNPVKDNVCGFFVDVRYEQTASEESGTLRVFDTGGYGLDGVCK